MKKIRKRVNVGRSRRKEIFQTIMVFLFAAVVAVAVMAGILWAVINDKTNVDAQKVWTQESKDLDARIEFLKAHPKAEPLGD